MQKRGSCFLTLSFSAVVMDLWSIINPIIPKTSKFFSSPAKSSFCIWKMEWILKIRLTLTECSQHCPRVVKLSHWFNVQQVEIRNFLFIRVSSWSTGLESAISKGTFDFWWMTWKHCGQQSSLWSRVSSTACLIRSVYLMLLVLKSTEVSLSFCFWNIGNFFLWL